jgi:hypothetical protein
LHPDHRQFIDSRLQELSQALREIDPESTGLAVRDSTAIAEAQVSLAVAIKEEAKNVRELETQAISATTDSFRIPHISLATASAIVGFLWLVPKTLGDHPVLGVFAHRWFVNLIWGIIFTGSLLLWAAVWLFEQWKKKRIKSVLSATAQKEALNSFWRRDDKVFSGQAYQDELYPPKLWYFGTSHKLLKLLGRRYYHYGDATHDPILAEQAARLGIERALAKGWIRKCRAPKGARTADDWFEVLREDDESE